MKESNFANEIKQSFDTIEDCYYQKIPDSYEMKRFVPVKYFDSFVVCFGNFIAMEFKMSKSKGAFPFSRVRDIQKDTLEEIHQAGGKSLIVINFRWTKFNKAIAIHIDDFIDMEKYYKEEHGRKSIPWKDIEKWTNEETGYQNRIEDGIILLSRTRQNNKVIWDVSSLIG